MRAAIRLTFFSVIKLLIGNISDTGKVVQQDRSELFDVIVFYLVDFSNFVHHLLVSLWISCSNCSFAIHNAGVVCGRQCAVLGIFSGFL